MIRITHTSRAATHVGAFHPVLLCALALLVLLGWPSRPLDAQLVVGRGLARTPGTARAIEPTSDSRFAPWVEFQHAAAAEAGAMGWNYKLGLHSRLLALPRRFLLTVELGHEMVATNGRGLAFDPRGAVWSEELQLRSPVFAGWQFTYGAFIRCRHDIDPLTGGEASAAGEGERVIILSGGRVSATSPRWRLHENGATLQFTAAVEQFGRTVDKREPAVPGSPLWDNARGAASVAAALDVPLAGRARAFGRIWHSAVHFATPTQGARGTGARRTPRANSRVELGVRLPSTGGAMDLLVAREHTFDDMLLFVPRANTTLLLGVRLLSSELR